MIARSDGVDGLNGAAMLFIDALLSKAIGFCINFLVCAVIV